MPVYTVHGPLAGDGARRADRIVLVRDDFHFWAFVFGPFWLIWHRMWLALLGYAAVVPVVMIALAVSDVPSGSRMVAQGLIALLFGFEAPSLRRWTLSRGKWRQLGIVAADDEDSAERRFFDSAAGRFGSERNAPRDYTGLTRPQPHGASPDIIGLFPQPGAPR